MTQKELLENYNLNLDDADCDNVDGLYRLLLDYEIVTESELELVTSINGYNIQTLLDVIYCRCGLRGIDQLVEELADEE